MKERIPSMEDWNEKAGIKFVKAIFIEEQEFYSYPKGLR